MAGPLMVPATITVWIFLVSSGYALVYYAGMDGRTFSFSSSGLEPSLMEAFYFSGVTIATLGLGDVTPPEFPSTRSSQSPRRSSGSAS
jgi:hypothetical protein